MSRYTEDKTIAGVMMFLVFVLLLWAAVMLFTGAAFAQDPGPTPQTAVEWWDWFAAQKTAVIKTSRVTAGTAENRPLEEEITLTDPKLLPAGVWGVRRYRKYKEEIRDGRVVGLWHQGETYEIIAKPKDAIVPSDKLTAWSIIKLDPKYNPTAEVAPR